MDDLEIRLFGGLEIRRAGRLLPSLPSRYSRNLLAYLVLNPHRRIERDVLCGQIWGDRTDRQARKVLRTALWQIRSVLEPEEEDEGTVVHTEGDRIGIPGTGSVWIDTDVFEECIRAVPGPEDGSLGESHAERLSRAVTLYRGDLLEGTYDDWCLAERERLRLAYLRALERLVRFHEEREQWLTGVARAQQILRLDPLREHIHRKIMIYHWAMGDRPSALRQYERCVKILREELDIEPMDETRELFERIRSGSRPVLPLDPAMSDAPGLVGESRPGEGAPVGGDVDSVLATLHAVARWLERKRGTLGDGEGEMESFPNPSPDRVL